MEPTKEWKFPSNGHLIRNRTVLAALTNKQSNEDGTLSNEEINFLLRRADGGFGIVTTAASHVMENGQGWHGEMGVWGDHHIPGLTRLAQGLRERGATSLVQIFHGGMRAPAELIGCTPISASINNENTGNEAAREMTSDEIEEMIEAFAAAAERCEKAGMDGVEIHGAHGYLIDQFFWEGTNQRTDSYGGSMAARSRFAIELIEACRSEVGPDFPIILRWSQWKQQDYEAKLVNSPEELERFLKPLVEAGVDIFHASTRRFWEPEFEGSDLNLAGWTQKLSGKPTMSVGSVGLTEDFISGTFASKQEAVEKAGIDELVERMNNHGFELIAVGRALLQDPEWLIKVKEGRLNEVESFAKKSLAKLY